MPNQKETKIHGFYVLIDAVYTRKFNHLIMPKIAKTVGLTMITVGAILLAICLNIVLF